jgi:hypothetical protein
MKEIMDKRDLENENRWLKAKVEKRDARIKEAEDYIAKLSNGIEVLKAEAGNKQNIWVERFLKITENPPDWVKLLVLHHTKGTPALSGTGTAEANKQEGLSESDNGYILILKKMEEHLDEKQLESMMVINDKLADEPDLIPEVAGLLDIKLL